MRFYNPTPRQYESTYIDQKLPYDYLLKAGQQKQNKYDENLAKVQGLKKEIIGLPIDQREIAEKQKLIDSKINDFIGSIPNQDYTEPGFQRKLLQTQQELSTIQRESAKAYSQRLKDVEGLKEQISKTTDPNYKQHLATQLKEYYNPNGDPNLAANYNEQTGTYNPANQLSHFDYRKRPEIDKDLIDITKSINEDKKSWLSNTGQTIDQFHTSLAKGSTEFISRSKGIQSLLAKSGDEDMIKSLLIQKNPDISPKELDALSSLELQHNKVVDKNGNFIGFNTSTFSGKELQSALDAAVYTKKDIDRNIIQDPLANAKHQEELASKTTSSQSESLANTGLADITKDLEFDSKGNLKADTKKTTVKRGGYDEFGVYDPNRIDYKDTGEMDLNKLAEHVKIVKSIQDNHPELQGLTPKKTVEAYRKAQTSLAQESIPLKSVSNQFALGKGDAIARNKTQRNFYLYDGKEKTLDGQLSTVLDKLGIEEKDFDKALEKGISGYTQAGPSAGSYYLEVKDSDGNSRRVMISPDNEMKKIFTASQVINDARKTLSKQVVTPYEDHPDIKILVNPTIQKDGTTKWQYVKLRLDNNGNPIELEPTTLEEIRKEENEALKESGYLGTEVGILKPHQAE